jgi:hypothetical protein
LPPDECQQQRAASQQRADGWRAGPSGVAALHQGPDQRDDPAGHQGDSWQVEPPRRAVAFRQQPHAERRGGQPGRHVEPEDPLPAQALGNGTAGERAGRDGQPGQAAVDTDDQPAPLRGECGGEDRQAQRQDDCRTESLNRARRDQHGGVGSQRTCG